VAVGRGAAGVSGAGIGTLAGMGAYALAGATIGSAFPVAGTIVGLAAGAAVGAFVGWWSTQRLIEKQNEILDE
jgi:hypothetical protein